jgi:hypothetical protein
MDKKRAGRMTDVPQLGPEIFVDDEHDITRQAAPAVSPFLSPLDTEDPRQAFVSQGWGGGRRRRGTETSILATPLSLIGPSFSPKSSPQQSPHKATNSAFSFETEELDEMREGSRHHSRGGSTAENVLEVLDNSVWGESIRRSFTLRRPSAGGSS